MSEERARLAPAIGLVKDRIAGPPPRPASPLRPSRQANPTPTEPPAAGQPEPSEDSSESPPKPATRKKVGRPRTSETSTGGSRRTTISLPRDLARALRDHLRTTEGLSKTAFVLGAVEAHHDELAALVEAEEAASRPRSSLFPDSIVRSAQFDEAVGVNLDTTENNLKTLDTVAAACGARSRSQLVRVALRAALSS